MPPRSNEAVVIDQLYDAALGKVGWGEVAVELARLFDGITLNLLEIDPSFQSAEIIATCGFLPEHHETFKDHFVAHDLWSTEAFRKRLLDRPLISADFVSDETFQNSVIYNDFLKKTTGSFYVAGGVIRTERNTLLSFGAHRPKEAAAFDSNEREIFERLIPHLKRAVDLRSRLSIATAGSEGEQQILDRVSLPLVQISAGGKVVGVNLAAKAILEIKDGLACLNNELIALAPNENHRLQMLIGQAIAVTSGASGTVPGGWMGISRKTGLRPYGVMVSPLGRDRTSFTAKSAAALVFIADPEKKSQVPLAMLGDLFGLTAGESRVVVGIAAGRSLPMIAAETGVSHNTVRTLLGRAMAKTETRSQLELAQLVLSMAPRLLEP